MRREREIRNQQLLEVSFQHIFFLYPSLYLSLTLFLSLFLFYIVEFPFHVCLDLVVSFTRKTVLLFYLGYLRFFVFCRACRMLSVCVSYLYIYTYIFSPYIYIHLSIYTYIIYDYFFYNEYSCIEKLSYILYIRSTTLLQPPHPPALSTNVPGHTRHSLPTNDR